MQFPVRKAILVTLVISVVVLAITAINYRMTKHIVEKTVITRQEDMTNKAVNTVEIWLNQQMKILEATANSLPLGHLQESPATMQLLHMAMQAGHFSDVYVGTVAGKLIDGAKWLPPAGYDPRKRPWYQRAIHANSISFTTPYIDLVTNDLVIALVKPLYHNGTLMGVVGADTVLDSLVQNVLNFKQGKSGYAFIVEKNGTVIVHPERNYVMRADLRTIEPALKDVVRQFTDTPHNTMAYKGSDEHNHLFSYKKIGKSDWYLCLTIPEEEAYLMTRETTAIFAMEIVLRILSVLSLVVLFALTAGGAILFIVNRHYSTAVRQQQEKMSGMSKDLAWNISKRMEVETYYKTLFNVVNDAILISHDRHYVECNQKALEMFNLSREELLSRTIFDCSAEFQPDGTSSRERFQTILQDAKNGGQNVFRWSFLRGNGSEFPTSVSLTTFQLNDRELVLSSIRDESKRVHAEGQLMQAQKMAVAGEMLGAIAHQWRQPLNTLSTYISSFQAAYYNSMLSHDFVEKVVSGAGNQITFMSKTIDDFRNFFKPSKSKGPVDILKAVISAIKLLEAQVQQSNISLTARNKTGADALFAFGYQGEFIHVLVNILGNAKDAILERVEQDQYTPRTIDISVSSEEDLAIIQIVDSGGGIPAPLLERIFTPYFTTKGSSSGMGLGLYMSKMIVEKEMGGQLLVENTGQGTQFTIKLKRMNVTDDQ